MIKRIDQYLFGTADEGIQYSKWDKFCYYAVLVAAILFMVSFVITIL